MGLEGQRQESVSFWAELVHASSAHWILLLLSKILDQVLFHFRWICCWSVPGHNLTLLVNHKLRKVPLDKAAEGSALLGLHVLPERMNFVTVDVHLACQIPTDLVAVREGLDLSL